jgi:hypothetical protein
MKEITINDMERPMVLTINGVKHECESMQEVEQIIENYKTNEQGKIN